MLDWFKKKEKESAMKNIDIQSIIQVDMHSHLLFGLDDGARKAEDTLNLVKKFIELGYKKMVFTPHVMLDGYRNTPEIIKNRLADVQNLLQENNINLEIEAAAEYYLDEGLWTKLRDKTPLLTFGDEKKYLLFESGFRNKPQGLKELVFEMQAQGYKPILAHPERYYYLHNDFDTIEDLISRGVLMQINLVSLAGFYGEDCKEVAEELINEKMVHFVGSDCHSLSYVNAIKEIRKQGIYEELAELNLLNNSLLTT